jgi:hypothetical protein
MYKVYYENSMPYSYEPNRMGAKYLIDGAYKNHGEFLESAVKFHRGLDYRVNPLTKWNEGSDIEETHESIKSSRSTLACIYGETIDEILEVYFENVASFEFTYVIDIDNMIYEYHMNKSEFCAFCQQFARLTDSSKGYGKKVYLMRTSMKTIEWLEKKMGW